MLRFLVDENFNYDIVRGVERRNPSVGLVRAQDVGLRAANDPTLLEWASQTGRVVLTHDVTTMTHYAYERVRAGRPMPGVFEISRNVPVGQAIEDILLISQCSLANE